MGKRDYDLGDGGFTMPATESIDEALERLARQDARRSADGGLGIGTTETAPTAFQALRSQRPGQSARARGLPTPPASALPPGWGASTPLAASQQQRRGIPSYSSLPATTEKPARDVGLTIVRWVLVLGASWLVWRFFIRGL